MPRVRRWLELRYVRVSADFFGTGVQYRFIKGQHIEQVNNDPMFHSPQHL